MKGLWHAVTIRGVCSALFRHSVFEKVHKNVGMFLGTSCPFMPASEERMLRTAGKRLVKSLWALSRSDLDKSQP